MKLTAPPSRVVRITDLIANVPLKSRRYFRRRITSTRCPLAIRFCSSSQALKPSGFVSSNRFPWRFEM
jgi:hypothetical protein